MQTQRGTGDGFDRGNGVTVVVPDKTVLADAENGQKPLIFAWLIRSESEEITRIADDEFTIGSGPDVRLRIRSEEVKSLHCSIYFVQNHFELNDHNSRSGTWVNDRSIKRQELDDGDRIMIGGQSFLFRCFRRDADG